MGAAQNILKKCYHLFTPKIVKKKIYSYKETSRCKEVKEKIITTLRGLDDEEFREIIDFLENNPLGVFPYGFVHEYSADNVEVYRDTDGYPYVIFQGKKLFGKRFFTDREFAEYYNGLLIEQDERSPHCYLVGRNRLPRKGSVIADIGAAEGIFALSVVDMASKIYMFECSDDWVEPLKRTFANYMDKVEIVNEFVGSVNNDSCTTLDKFFQNRRIDYIKADVEGAEKDLLTGGRKCFHDKVEQVLLCMYHKHGDEDNIKEMFCRYGMKYDINEGYMIFMYDEHLLDELPYIRRGVVYGYRSDV